MAYFWGIIPIVGGEAVAVGVDEVGIGGVAVAEPVGKPILLFVVEQPVLFRSSLFRVAERVVVRSATIVTVAM